MGSAKFRAPFLFLFVLLFCTGPLAALDPHRTISQYILDHWQEKEGLDQSTIQAITQTRDGYLWMGTRDGLVRFDGVHFAVFNSQTTPAISHNNISDLVAGPDGTLYIGTSDAGVVSLKQGVFRQLRGCGEATISVRSLALDTDGSLWIGSFGHGVTRCRNGVAKTFTTADGLPSNTVRSLHVASGGVWVGTDLGLRRIAGGQLVVPAESRALEGSLVNAIEQDEDGTLWVAASPSGIFRLSGPNARKYTIRDGLGDGNIRNIKRDRSGNLWIATSGGLSRLHGEHFETLSKKDGLSHDFVRVIYEDVEGSLWLGLFGGGLNRLKDTKFSNYTTSEGLSGDFVFTVLQARDGSEWIGTLAAGLNRLQNGKITIYTTRDGLPGNTVWSLAEDSEGTIWIGTGGNGLGRYREGRFQPVPDSGHFSGKSIKQIVEGPDRSLWVAADNGLYRLRDGHWRLYQSGEREATLMGFSSVNVDESGKVLVAGVTGLWRLDGEVLTSVALGPVVAQNKVQTIFRDRDGTVWLATNGSGLIRIRGAEVTRVSGRQGLPDDIVYQILEDDADNLWMSSNKGVFRAPRSQLNLAADGKISTVDFKLYGVADGMKSSECNGGGGGQPAGSKSRDGRLWFPTVKGVTVIDARNIGVNRLPPPVEIEMAVAGGINYLSQGSAVLPRGGGDLEVSYAGLSLFASNQVRFRYQLVGFDRNWVDAGNRRTAYYTGLPPGRYQFRVIAANNDGVWNLTGAVCDIRMPALLYQMLWFRIGLGLAAALLALWFLRMREARLRVQRESEAMGQINTELEARVARRTAALASANEELKRAAAARQRTEEALRQAQKMEAVGQLAGGIAHDFNNLLQVINGYSGMVLKKMPEGSPQHRQVQAVLRAGQRAAELTQQLLAFSHKQVIHPSVLDLTAAVQESLSLLHRLLPENIELITGFDSRPVWVKADRGQIDQVLLNLAANARDAMPEGGTLRIRTALEEIPPDYLQTHPGSSPGTYCVLALEDSGVGMDEAVRQRASEPFFTTKPQGKGTGLGLSTVYGIAAQNNGWIEIDSEVGRGSSLALYLPMCDPRDATPDDSGPAETAGGTETILVVEDQPSVLAYAVDILRDAGYQVLGASDTAECLAVAQEHPGPIHLLLSDVIMPVMNGREVARRILQFRPEVRVLFMSGYAEDVVIDDGLHFIPKPFEAPDLLRKVREVLA